MTQRDLFPTTISSVVDIPASRSRLLDLEKEKKMTGTSGRSCLKLLHAKDPLGSFAKTFMVTLPWVSTKCSLTWKVKATPQGRLLFQLVPKTHLIEGTDSGLLHTPTAKANQMSPSMKKRDKGSWGKEPTLWATPQATDGTRLGQIRTRDQLSDKAKKGGCKNLREEVHQFPQEPPLWKTPLVDDAKNVTPNPKRFQGLYAQVQMWPTPRVSDTEGAVVKNVEMNNGSFSRKNKDGVRWGVKLKDAVHHVDKSSGQLNPTWVEWLMGYPEGWTDLKD